MFIGNRAAFAWNGLLWMAIVLSLGLGLGLLTSLLGIGQMLPLLAVPMGLFLSTVFYASLYFTFVDCFMSSTPDDLLSNKP